MQFCNNILDKIFWCFAMFCVISRSHLYLFISNSKLKPKQNRNRLLHLLTLLITRFCRLIFCKINIVIMGVFLICWFVVLNIMRSKATIGKSIQQMNNKITFLTIPQEGICLCTCIDYNNAFLLHAYLYTVSV